MKKIAVLGYGTIGSGVVEAMKTNEALLAIRAGEPVQVTKVLDLREFPGDPVASILTHDFQDIVRDPEISVVVETMGGVKPAYDFVKECLQAGKSVCSSNKELVAKHGAELLQVAKEKKVNFFFEASVGGGIPIIRPLNESLAADEIDSISGILNGTTNFILTKMGKEGADYHTVLKEAQELGYAEKNPEADVEGYDACRKIAILTSLANGQQVDYEDIYTEGITGITTEDFAYAKALGGDIKIFGMSRKVKGKVYALVAPFLIGPNHPLKSVHDVFNGILVHGNILGDAMFYGRGAGKLPTASAVCGDVMEAVKNQGRTVPMIWKSEKLVLGEREQLPNRFFVRLSGTKEENEKKVKEVFGEVKEVEAGLLEYAFITQERTEGEFAQESKAFPNLITRIRVQE